MTKFHQIVYVESPAIDRAAYLVKAALFGMLSATDSLRTYSNGYRPNRPYDLFNASLPTDILIYIYIYIYIYIDSI